LKKHKGAQFILFPLSLPSSPANQGILIDSIGEIFKVRRKEGGGEKGRETRGGCCLNTELKQFSEG
jgi:hypothetical protein